ncbi:MAG TPA: 8-oxo-dGTP diphosphatase [Candidatus Paceibacterota bacterium]|jgi:8-oxo-dGTP pyrophosphatase MutT (NUDIX family)|nr:8-oxo-dGTP diphosphatase [Candidatus Paceibacterota bacterium]
MTQTTLCFLIDDQKILLAMKKRGFGTGKWNGVGGKVIAPETLEEAIIRETEEEIGVSIDSSDLQKVAVLSFHFIDEHADWNQQCHVYLSKVWKNEPQESEEMKPEWYAFADVPYDDMWIDDKLWLPLVIAGKKIEADFYFKEEGKVLDRYGIKEL